MVWVLVVSVFLDLEVHANTVQLGGEVTFMAEVIAEELDTFAFELLDVMTVSEVWINDVSHTFIHENAEGFVPLQNPIANGELFTAKIAYEGTPPTGGFFSGISHSVDWGKHVVWTLSEPFAARDWWPTKRLNFSERTWP